jgi:alpha-1,2-mannosyltransferase
MLTVSPIVWTHYFLWLLPAVILLATKRKLVITVALLSTIGLVVVPARGLGSHLLLGYFLSGLVAWTLLTHPEESQETEAETQPLP